MPQRRAVTKKRGDQPGAKDSKHLIQTARKCESTKVAGHMVAVRRGDTPIRKVASQTQEEEIRTKHTAGLSSGGKDERSEPLMGRC